MKRNSDDAVVGILGWQDKENVNIPGSLAVPDLFPFPVTYQHVEGACFETIISHPSTRILNNMIEASRQLEMSGVKAITTSCGFNSIVQRELSEAVSIPVFTSTLILLPLIHNMLKQTQAVGLLTVDASRLTIEHFSKAGVPDDITIHVAGIEDTEAFTYMCQTPTPERVDLVAYQDSIIQNARNLVDRHPDIGAIVSESTIFHVFTDDIKKETNLPVFDIVQLIRYIYQCVV